MKRELEAFDRLLKIMSELREKCPWDRKQTMASLRNLTIEETYELADAIIENDMNTVEEELGDLLLHIVFYTKIAEEQQSFDMAAMINRECEKLISRHPHIYTDLEVSGEEEVKQNWEKIKMKEGKRSVLQGVPNSLPAMVKAYRIQDKAKQVGFEWEDIAHVLDKVEEEIAEFKAEISSAKSNKEKLEAEFGDVLFSLINYSRYLNIDPETALEKTNKKFISRFQFIEQVAERSGKHLEQMTLEEMDNIWKQAKQL